jgi:PilZ domain
MAMTILDQYRISDGDGGRRSHRRVNTQLAMHCRRLGRTGFEETVHAVDLSPGGVRFLIDGRLITGDVVLLTLDLEGVEVQFKGLVVHVSNSEDGRRQAHVAFTGVSGSAQEALAELLDRSEQAVPQDSASQP